MSESLGVDVGTSAVKVVLLDHAQRVRGSVSEPLATQHPFPQWSEQDPQAWWKATERALDRLARTVPGGLSAVTSIGLAGQMHGLVALDAGDRPLRPAMLWNDGRARDEARLLEQLDGNLIERLGVQPTAGYVAPKLLWLRAHEPAVLERTRTLLLPKDYVRLCLTGERVTDVSDGSGTWLLDATTRDWCPAALAAVGIEAAILPPVIEGTAVSGQLRAALGRRWGMPDKVVVAGGGGDTACGGVGLGAVQPGRAFINLGTSGQIFIAADRHEPALPSMVQAFCHAVPGGWYRVAALMNGASPLAFVAGLLGKTDIAAALADTEARFRQPSDLLVLPYLAGERTPHNDPLATGAIFGLSPATVQTDILQAVLEGVAFSFADAFDALGGRASGVQSLNFIGGGARSTLWGRIIASVLDLPLLRVHGSEHGSALGAARLGLVAGGLPLGEVTLVPDVLDVIEPEARLTDAYRRRVEAFRQLYRQTRHIGRDLSVERRSPA